MWAICASSVYDLLLWPCAVEKTFAPCIMPSMTTRIILFSQVNINEGHTRHGTATRVKYQKESVTMVQVF